MSRRDFDTFFLGTAIAVSFLMMFERQRVRRVAAKNGRTDPLALPADRKGRVHT